jgi:hypothetical protein
MAKNRTEENNRVFREGLVIGVNDPYPKKQTTFFFNKKRWYNK